MESKRLNNLDLFKGLLIIFVIIGHLLQGKMNEHIWRTIIYSFHMPVFISISGFLFNINRVAKYSLFTLLKEKYLFRMVVPWIIAIFTYYFLFFTVAIWGGYDR